MNVFVLTSSRADFGIYLPLLRKTQSDPFFQVKIIAFGTHFSEAYGSTYREIENNGFKIDYRVNTLPDGDTPFDISFSTGKTIELFAELWNNVKNEVDLVLCLGDRYEMFAAVSASIPFNLKVAHLHGGETTLGAIDNKYRHSITHMSDIHFASTQKNATRVTQLIGSDKNVFNVGALSLDNLNDIQFLTDAEFKQKFNIPIDNPVLVTFHPETVSFEKNEMYAEELIAAMNDINDQIIITLPNADTHGMIIRNKLIEFAKARSNVFTVESLGTQGYFTCMKKCRYMLGNTSSGIIEAASFGKYVIDLGDRQKGRECGGNVIHCEIKRNKIINAIDEINNLAAWDLPNIYGNGNTADNIISLLKENK